MGLKSDFEILPERSYRPQDAMDGEPQRWSHVLSPAPGGWLSGSRRMKAVMASRSQSVSATTASTAILWASIGFLVRAAIVTAQA